MDRFDREALDRHITDGRYSKEVGYVTCAECGEQTLVTIETEYGGSFIDLGECKYCQFTFNDIDSEQFEIVDPEEIKADRMEE